VTLRLDDARMMASAVPSGVGPQEWNELAVRFGDVHAAFAKAHAAGRIGFTELDAQAAEFARASAFAEGRRRATDVVVLGIGGSALGVIALRTALAAPGADPRLHVVDNVDPLTFAGLLADLPLTTTQWVVVSKSGATVETLAQYAIVRERLAGAGLDAAAHLTFVTDPAEGALRAIATRDGIACFDVPPNVGGRFSALTPVGTVPALLAGYDAAAFVAGARAMRDRCATPSLQDNPAGQFAALHWRAHQRAGQGTHVMMAYSDGLRDIAPWFVQLWAESLGKTDADGIPVGPTPVAARGATDQHSLLQLLMEGPADKVVSFVRVATHPHDLTIPAVHLPSALAFAGGHTLGALLDAEADATARALVSAGRPSLTLTVDAADAHAIGELMMLLMIATVYAGTFYRVNPFGQPGVGLGKRLARETLAARNASS
jgi:glucose-6-phosphate isomerase